MDHRIFEKIITATILIVELIKDSMNTPKPGKPPRIRH